LIKKEASNKAIDEIIKETGKGRCLEGIKRNE
jgi:hypothetical protein